MLHVVLCQMPMPSEALERHRQSRCNPPLIRTISCRQKKEDARASVALIRQDRVASDAYV